MNENEKKVNKLYKWWQKNLDKLIYGHYREIALICPKDYFGYKVLGYFKTTREALEITKKVNFPFNVFLAQPCVPDSECEAFIAEENKKNIWNAVRVD